MFHEGYYLEVIKAKYSAATAVITVKEKTVEIKSKKVTTNKWLSLEDWYSLYEILAKALLQNAENSTSKSTREKRKLTRHLEIAYTFEACENPSDRESLPTIKVVVSPVRKKSKRKKSETEISSKKLKSKKLEHSLNCDLFSDDVSALDCDTDCLKVEEYIPNAPNMKKRLEKKEDEGSREVVGYVPSRKSTLEYLQQSVNSNECYVPSVLSDEAVLGSEAIGALYVPNSIPKNENLCDTYEPSSILACSESGGGEYIPNSKGVRKKVDEYQPDFIARNKTMKFDNSYVPSSSQRIKELKKNDRKSSLSSKSRSRRRSKNRETETGGKEPNSPQLNRKNSAIGQSEIRREM